ncbi:hypothetical protein ACWIGW_44330 [Nocardia brasiliensis]|uniref:hypothetical protein n=1 Tax=Streptomyces sp. NPDC056056 TaxID=3345698 RepID=UPI0035D5BFE7
MSKFRTSSQSLRPKRAGAVATVIRTARTLTRRPARAAGFLFRTPALLFALLAAATLVQGALLLTVNRAPSDTATPMTVAAPRADGCVMLCAEADTPADSWPAPVMAAHPIPMTASTTASISSCWMFCSEPESAHLDVGRESWRLNL